MDGIFRSYVVFFLGKERVIFSGRKFVDFFLRVFFVFEVVRIDFEVDLLGDKRNLFVLVELLLRFILDIGLGF